jgi:hypothetical protein
MNDGGDIGGRNLPPRSHHDEHISDVRGFGNTLMILPIVIWCARVVDHACGLPLAPPSSCARRTVGTYERAAPARVAAEAPGGEETIPHRVHVVRVVRIGRQRCLSFRSCRRRSRTGSSQLSPRSTSTWMPLRLSEDVERKPDPHSGPRTTPTGQLGRSAARALQCPARRAIQVSRRVVRYAPRPVRGCPRCPAVMIPRATMCIGFNRIDVRTGPAAFRIERAELSFPPADQRCSRPNGSGPAETSTIGSTRHSCFSPAPFERDDEEHCESAVGGRRRARRADPWLDMAPLPVWLPQPGILYAPWR